MVLQFGWINCYGFSLGKERVQKTIQCITLNSIIYLFAFVD